MASIRTRARICSRAGCASYNDQSLLGTTVDHRWSEFQPRSIRCTRRSRAWRSCARQQPALRRGRQIVRAHGKTPGLFAASRLGNDGREIVVAFNTSMSTVVAQIEVEATSAVFRRLRGACAPKASAPGSFSVEVPPSATWYVRAAAPMKFRRCSLLALRVCRADRQTRRQYTSIAVGCQCTSPGGALIVSLRVNGEGPPGVFHPSRRQARSSTGRASVSSWPTRQNSSATSRSRASIRRSSTKPGSSPGENAATCAITARSCA